MQFLGRQFQFPKSAIGYISTYTREKPMDCISLTEKVTLMGGLLKYFLVKAMHLQIFRPVELVLLIAEGKTGFALVHLYVTHNRMILIM